MSFSSASSTVCTDLNFQKFELELNVEKEVVRMYAEHGKEVKFEWKREGLNHSVPGKGWRGKLCRKTFSQVGKFVVLGRSSRVVMCM
jgi:sigma54-dependent transcription regulator